MREEEEELPPGGEENQKITTIDYIIFRLFLLIRIGCLADLFAVNNVMSSNIFVVEFNVVIILSTTDYTKIPRWL